MTYRFKPAATVCAMALLAVVACTPSTSAEPSTEPSAAASEGAFAGQVQVSFDGTIPDGWAAGDDYPVPDTEALVFEIQQDERVLDAECVAADPAIGESADEFSAALADREGLGAGDRSEVTVDDLSGFQLDFKAIADSPDMTCAGDDNTRFVPLWIDPDTGGYAGAGATEDNRLIVLDVPESGNLLIWAYAVAPEVLADNLDAVMSVVDGLRFEVP